ncbi:MAG TPA: hypothetical protein VGF30_15695 [Bacteroidia bacterium]
MIKTLIILITFLALSCLAFFMTSETIEETEYSRKRLLNVEKDLHIERILSHLTAEERNRLISTYTLDLDRLNRLHITSVFVAALCIILLIVFVAAQNFSINPFDGLTLLLCTLFLILIIPCLFYIFNTQFENGHNGTIDASIAAGITLLLLSPLLFLTAYLLNVMEIKKVLHQQKWISVVSIVLMSIFTLIAMIIGVGVLFTPDLSGNIT